MAGALGYKLGIKRRVLAERHSVSFGFTIARRDGTPFDFEALTCYGERTADGIDYLSLFPVPSGMRANLFMFRDPTDPIMRELRRRTGSNRPAAAAGTAALPRRFPRDRQGAELGDGSDRGGGTPSARNRPHRRCVPDQLSRRRHGRRPPVGGRRSPLHGARTALARKRRHGHGEDLAVLFRSRQARGRPAVTENGALPSGPDVPATISNGMCGGGCTSCGVVSRIVSIRCIRAGSDASAARSAPELCARSLAFWLARGRRGAGRQEPEIR